MASSELKDGSEYISKRFTDLRLANTQFSSIEFDGCTFRGCDFTETHLDRCKFIDCHFVQCNFSNTLLGYSRFSQISFTDSKLIGLDWNKANWPSFAMPAAISFERCILNSSSFMGLELGSLQLLECKAHEVDFRECNLADANFRFTDFTCSQFNNTNLAEADFCEALNYDIDVFSNNLKGAKFSRIEAVNLLESVGIELFD